MTSTQKARPKHWLKLTYDGSFAWTLGTSMELSRIAWSQWRWPLRCGTLFVGTRPLVTRRFSFSGFYTIVGKRTPVTLLTAGAGRT